MAEQKRAHLDSADARHPNQDSDEATTCDTSSSRSPSPTAAMSNDYSGVDGLSDQDELRVVLQACQVVSAEQRSDQGGLFTVYAVDTRRSDTPGMYFTFFCISRACIFYSNKNSVCVFSLASFFPLLPCPSSPISGLGSRRAFSLSLSVLFQAARLYLWLPGPPKPG